jgi:hypothetical protein
LLVAVAVSRVGDAHRVSDAEGALDSDGATWTIEAAGDTDDRQSALSATRVRTVRDDRSRCVDPPSSQPRVRQSWDTASI